MAPTFTPTPSADGFQLSNPSVLCMASLLASLRLFAEAGMGPLRQKSLALTGAAHFDYRYWQCLLSKRVNGSLPMYLDVW
eukprot:COSAG05_NODE_49_length_24373_cov_16.162561_34_plen_80_part_00